MGPVQKFLIFLLFLSGNFIVRSQETTTNFRDTDRVSLELFQAGKWKALIQYNNRALKEGFDYYYLRMRTGIAWYEKKNYMQAARHLNEALNLNAADPVALEYLFGCYLELNKSAEALKIYRQLPADVRKGMESLRPKLMQADFSAGNLFSDQPEKFDQFDLDGADNIYGETDMVTGGYNFNAGLSQIFIKGLKLYGGYILIKQDKNKLVQVSDTLLVDDQYVLRQHQFYLSGSVPVMKGLTVNPAFHYIQDRFNVVMPVYHEETFSYSFPVDSVRMDAFIGYLSVTRDFQLVQASLFAAWSNLNDQEQIQAGFYLLAYPFGNLNFYLSSKLMNHRNEGENYFVYEQMAGVRLFKPLWAEANATFGEMRNYYENNAYVVYNLADRMKFKGGGRLVSTLTSRWMISAEYIYLLREGDYIVYMPIATGEDEELIPVTMPQNFHNHLVVITITCKF